MKEQIDEVNNERVMLSKLKHPSIISMKCAWADKNHYYMLFELALNGDLTGFLRRHGNLQHSMVQYFSSQIIATLGYLRTQNIVHRDLKPANIMINENFQIKLADFGTAKKILSSGDSNNSAGGISQMSYISGMSNVSNISNISGLSDNLPEDFEEMVGTESYISPEMLESRQYSYASDLWALGIIIFQCFTGYVPFRGRNQDETFEKIKKCEYEMPSEIPEVAQDLIQQLLKKNPEARIGAQNLIDIMNHKFFAGIEFKTICMQSPPVNFDLSKIQTVMVKYLPQNKDKVMK